MLAQVEDCEHAGDRPLSFVGSSSLGVGGFRFKKQVFERVLVYETTGMELRFGLNVWNHFKGKWGSSTRQLSESLASHENQRTQFRILK